MNAFDKIAKKAPETKKTTKVAAKVNDDLKAAVDSIIRLKGEVARLEADRKVQEDLVTTAVRSQQDDLAFKGSYNKSFSVAGSQGEITYTTSDRFTLPKDDASIEAIRKLLGDRWEQVIEEKRTITFKADAAENKTLVDKIMKAITAAGLDIGDVFDVVDSMSTTKEMDRRQYELFTDKELAVWRTLVTQYKPAIK